MRKDLDSMWTGMASSPCWPSEGMVNPQITGKVWSIIIGNPGHPDQFPYVDSYYMPFKCCPTGSQHVFGDFLSSLWWFKGVFWCKSLCITPSSWGEWAPFSSSFNTASTLLTTSLSSLPTALPRVHNRVHLSEWGTLHARYWWMAKHTLCNHKTAYEWGFFSNWEGVFLSSHPSFASPADGSAWAERHNSVHFCVWSF